MTAAVDANVLIYASKPGTPFHAACQVILRAHREGRLKLTVSNHTIAELERKPDEALEIAKSLDVLPYRPMGTIKDLLGTIAELPGTIGDMKWNQEQQEAIHALLNSGNDIRDRGALLDSLRAGVPVFVTADRQLAAGGPAARINAMLGVRIVTPDDFARDLKSDPTL